MKFVFCLCSVLLLQVGCTTYATADQCEEPGSYVAFHIDSGNESPKLIEETESILDQVLNASGLAYSERFGYSNDSVCTGEITIVPARERRPQAAQVIFSTTISTRSGARQRYLALIAMIGEQVVNRANQNELLAGKVMEITMIRAH